MLCHFQRAALTLCWLLVPVSVATAQLSGLRGGVTRTSPGESKTYSDPPLSPEIARGYITIEGQAEIRVKPSEIRVVLAITAEGVSPAQCKQQVSKTLQTLNEAWEAIDIPQENIVEDFIAVLPRYEFEIETVGGREIAVEKKSGYLMQSNVHLAVPDDAQAMRAINIAFENDVADIIAFDYWSKDLDELKVKARSAALEAARDKSDVLMGRLFSQRPPVINLQESTRVFYPQSLYESFTNSSEAEYQSSYSRRDIPQIRLFRPKNTYYRGLSLDADITPEGLPMQSEISVVSTVRLYYKSPVKNETQEQ
jgi:uncharacterized protein YggE